jgi:molybdenum cofactor cytidylyltransferase
MEIVTRPQPRAAEEKVSQRVAGIVLAAGRSTRMGGPNKLTAKIAGKPLVRIATESMLASRARPVIVVTGHQRAEVEAQLRGLDVNFVHNRHYADGLSTSLKAGLAAVPDNCDGAVIGLGDMPDVPASLIDGLIDAFDPEHGALIVVPTSNGQRGNPVLWSRRLFKDLMAVEGDVGGRQLLTAYPEAVIDVPAAPGALLDIDTPEALAARG